MTVRLYIIINFVNRDSSRLARVDAEPEWNEFVSKEDGHVLQSYAWGELKSKFGWKAERWAQLEEGRISAGAQVLLRRLLPGMRVAYVPRGPVSTDANFLEELLSSMRKSGVFLLKLEPNWLRGEPGDAMLAAAGFHQSVETIQPPTTIRIDLTQSLDAIIGAMKSKWRYNIRLAEKKGAVVREGTARDLPAFYELTRVTAKRDRFAVHPITYYRHVFELLTARDAGEALCRRARWEGLGDDFCDGLWARSDLSIWSIGG